MAERVLVTGRAGLETVRGTTVPATRKVYGTTDLKRVQTRVAKDEASGTFANIIGASSISPPGTAGSAPAAPM